MIANRAVSNQTRQYFLQESADLLRTIDRELQDIQENFSLDKIHSLMRATHTLKGAAASVELDVVVKAAHAFEDVFKALCYKDTTITSEMQTLLFEGYDCLQQLLSAQQPAGEAVGENRGDRVQTRMAMVVTLDRMSTVMTRLKDLLGDRFDQPKQLPAANELGFDITHSIFEMGVAQRLQTLSETLKSPRPRELIVLLKAQAEVFVDLAESLNLPGFGEIARVTLGAIAQQPENILQIAPAALENFQAAQTKVLGGDRTQGGRPSAKLKQFYDPVHPVLAKAIAQSTQEQPGGKAISNIAPDQQSAPIHSPAPDNNRSTNFPNRVGKATPSEYRQTNWFKRQWQTLIQPIGDQSIRSHHTANFGQERTRQDSASPDKTHPNDTSPNDTSPDSTSSAELSDLAPTDLNYLDVRPKKTQTPFDSPPSLEIAIHDSSQSTSTSNPSKKSGSSVDADLKASAQDKETTIRIDIEQIDQLSQAMGELLTQQNQQSLYNEQLAALAKKLLNRIAQQQQQLNRQQIQIVANQRLASEKSDAPSSKTDAKASSFDYANFDALELDRYHDDRPLIQSVLEETVQQQETAEAIDLFVRQSQQVFEKQKRLLANTRETLLSARTVPLETVLSRFVPVVARLQAQHRPKLVDLDTAGGEVTLDRVIADRLHEPLLHLVRNAFDHGIEHPDSRVSQYKAAAGKITIESERQGRLLLIHVRDNGRGLDLEKIRRRAVENQLMSGTKAATLAPAQTIELLFESGFSTASQVDELSGRGVGLAVVQDCMRSLQGKVTVDHEPGAGTCFTLHIPTSLTIADLLLCQARGRTYALTTDAIEHILIPTEGQMRVWNGGKMLAWQTKEKEHLVPINALSEVLRFTSPFASYRSHHLSNPALNSAHPSQKATTASPIILIRDQERLMGIEIDQLLGEQALAISPPGRTVTPPDYLYGSSLLPDGQLALVLDGVMLAKRALALRQQNRMDIDSDRPNQILDNNKPVFVKQLILTIDDSITARNALCEALKKANYQVIQAQDGTEALRQLEKYPEVAAILCDIEMPGMNGFEFLKARARSPQIAAIPTIMVTSRGAVKHRLLAQELGATTYLTKPYLTPQLLNAISTALQQQASPTLLGDPYE